MIASPLSALLLLVAVPPTVAPTATLAPVPPGVDLIELGRHFFTRVWEPALAGPESGDGLGPLFNARSCAECHHQGGVGGGGEDRHNVQFFQPIIPGTESESYLARVSRTSFRVHSERWSAVVMLHRFGVPSEYAAWRADEIIASSRLDPAVKSNLRLSPEQPVIFAPKALAETEIVDYQPEAPLTDPLVLEVDVSPRAIRVAGDGTRLRVKRHPKPKIKLVTCGYGLCSPPYREATRFWEVNTPPLFGLGRLEDVSIADVTAIAAAQPEPIRGRASVLPDGRLGRFGWKAQHASLRDFTDEACAVELGVSTPMSRQAPLPRMHATDDEEKDSPFRQTNISNADISAAGVDALTAFIRSLPQPRETVDFPGPPATPGPPPGHRVRMPAVPIAPPGDESQNVRSGRFWFQAIGCATCHAPQVGPVSGIYSDLLLHDVGTETYGSYFQRDLDEHSAAPGEFRTPPLWGVADSAPYLHDGRAATLEQAIEFHGGQAEPAAKEFHENLTPNQRRQLVAFLKNLRAPLP